MYLLGVDGGTTKTIALVADEQGRILAAARGGGSNWSGEEVEIPMAVVAETAREALAQCGLSGDEIALGAFTLAGADWPEDHTRREAVLGRTGIARRVVVKNDAFGGLRAGTRDPYGMVLAVGTGMNAAVISPRGQEWAFGYYETFGGAGTFVRQAFEAVLRAEDGRGQPTLLTELLLERLGFATVEAMLRAHVLRQIERSRMASVTPLVFDAALAGDEAAAGILVRQGQALAEYAAAMARRFEMQRLAFDVVLAGSVFKGAGSLLADTIAEEVRRTAPLARIVRARFEPAAGSLLLAFDALRIPVTEEMYARLAQSMPGPAFFDTSSGAGPAPTRVETAVEEEA